MVKKWLECANCQRQYDYNQYIFCCPDCMKDNNYYGLEMKYDYKAVPEQTCNRWLEYEKQSIWKFQDLLPIDNPEHSISLGEGFTPLSKITFLEEFGFSQVWYKNESLNPTWSHKDRFNSVAISKAKELGFTKVTTSSTGNQGLSTAAYAARGGLQSTIFFPPETPKVMVDLASHYGALSIITQWNARDSMVEHLSKKGWFPAVSLDNLSLSSPYGVEGYKTIAYEFVAELGRVPDKVLVPVAGGNLLYGIYKGFKELIEIGLTNHFPNLIACQASGANPLEISYKKKNKYVEKLEGAYSLATSTREETAGDRALHSVYETNGEVISVTDIEIQDTMKLLGFEGYCVEAASALPVACLTKIIKEQRIDPNETIVCLLTSSGVKSPDILADLRNPAVRIGNSIDELDQVLLNWNSQ